MKHNDHFEIFIFCNILLKVTFIYTIKNTHFLQHFVKNVICVNCQKEQKVTGLTCLHLTC